MHRGMTWFTSRHTSSRRLSLDRSLGLLLVTRGRVLVITIIGIAVVVITYFTVLSVVVTIIPAVVTVLWVAAFVVVTVTILIRLIRRVPRLASSRWVIWLAGVPPSWGSPLLVGVPVWWRRWVPWLVGIPVGRRGSPTWR